MLLSAYEQGIFPWYSEGEPILWHSPEPRFVLEPRAFRIPKSVRKVLNKGRFSVTFDRDFPAVIAGCKTMDRAGQPGTWITDEMEEAYVELHRLGFAHSVEVWVPREAAAGFTLPIGRDGRVDFSGGPETGEKAPPEGDDGRVLVGGLYGVSLGAIYFGESMFSYWSDASKVGFVTLARRLFEDGFEMIDSQVYTEHVARFGAKEIPRDAYLSRLERLLESPTRRGSWQHF